MNGDLSLSGSLGGLRIANPDDEAVASPTSPVLEPTYPPHSAPVAASSYHSDDSYAQAFPSNGSAMSSSEAFEHSQRYNSQPSRPLGDFEQYPPVARQTTSIRSPTERPISSFYERGSPVNPPYYPQDAGTQQSFGLGRSSSRAAAPAAAMTGDMPTRSYSQRDRSYRQSQQYAVNGVIPPRRNSRRVPGHAPSGSQSGQLSGSPYTLEGGPLPSSEAWKERGAAVTTRQELDADGRPVSRVVKKGVKDFVFGRTLGEGSYSTVLAATDRQSSREYAIKVLDKRHIIKEKKVKYVNIEKDTLNRLTDHPGIVRLYYTFQDERSLYFVLDLATGGELLGVLKKYGTFDEECTRFFAAQLLDSIAYMHSRGVIHRDLKPENVLLDDHMHTKVTDFGTAKILDIKPQPMGGTGNDSAGDPLDGADSDRAVSFVGTAEYVSPELLTDKNACKASDLWAFGCIVYQLLAGRPPFKASNEYQTFQRIVALDYQFSDTFPPVARDLIERLLVLDPSKRLPIEHIKNHEFFDGIQWGKGLWSQKAPRLKPYVPPAGEPIRLNNGSNTALAPNVPMVSGNISSHPPSQQSGMRPQLRSVTELPPPSQLDIDWSPVLTRNNERILKLGNLVVTVAPATHSPKTGEGSSEAPRKLSRFFGGNTTKKRERLVMVTSTARIIVVAAGGDEKKVKLEVALSGPGTVYRSFEDSKGLTAFCVETVSKTCRYNVIELTVCSVTSFIPSKIPEQR